MRRFVLFLILEVVSENVLSILGVMCFCNQLLLTEANSWSVFSFAMNAWGHGIRLLCVESSVLYVGKSAFPICATERKRNS